jgi:DNA-binding XRE family transcriptional regulator
MTFGQKLRFIRKDILNMTQQELADSLDFTQAAINAIEKGTNKNASFDLIKKLVLVHHVNPMYFIYETSTEPPILKSEGSGAKPLKQKIIRYERLIDQLVKLKNGR